VQTIWPTANPLQAGKFDSRFGRLSLAYFAGFVNGQAVHSIPGRLIGRMGVVAFGLIVMRASKPPCRETKTARKRFGRICHGRELIDQEPKWS
jgi:hypothetical protein